MIFSILLFWILIFNNTFTFTTTAGIYIQEIQFREMPLNALFTYCSRNSIRIALSETGGGGKLLDEHF